MPHSGLPGWWYDKFASHVPCQGNGEDKMSDKMPSRLQSMSSRVQSSMQDYIENENGRLEREQQFWSKEIVVKIEYKYCPNLTIIDTPGAHLTKMWQGNPMSGLSRDRV